MKKIKTAPKKAKVGASATDWRVAMLARVRRLIEEAEPDVAEVVKWRKPSNPLGTRFRGGEQSAQQRKPISL